MKIDIDIRCVFRVGSRTDAHQSYSWQRSKQHIGDREPSRVDCAGVKRRKAIGLEPSHRRFYNVQIEGRAGFGSSRYVGSRDSSPIFLMAEGRSRIRTTGTVPNCRPQVLSLINRPSSSRELCVSTQLRPRQLQLYRTKQNKKNYTTEREIATE